MEKNIGGIKRMLGTGAINVFGLPFSGKDTVGQRLTQDLNAKFLSSGEILRKAEKEDEELAKELGKGNLANTDKFRDIVLPYFNHDELQDYPLVLSSVGRWSGEETDVMRALSEAGHELKAVLFLDIPEEEVWQRWQTAKSLDDRGERSDDNNEDVLRKRLSEFNEKTAPVLEHYEALGLLIKISGVGTRDQVYENVLNQLKSSLALASQ